MEFLMGTGRLAARAPGPLTNLSESTNTWLQTGVEIYIEAISKSNKLLPPGDPIEG